MAGLSLPRLGLAVEDLGVSGVPAAGRELACRCGAEQALLARRISALEREAANKDRQLAGTRKRVQDLRSVVAQANARTSATSVEAARWEQMAAERTDAMSALQKELTTLRMEGDAARTRFATEQVAWAEEKARWVEDETAWEGERARLTADCAAARLDVTAAVEHVKAVLRKRVAQEQRNLAELDTQYQELLNQAAAAQSVLQAASWVTVSGRHKRRAAGYKPTWSPSVMGPASVR